MQPMKQTLESVLAITDYAGDKSAFAGTFMRICEARAVSELIKTLPDQAQEYLQRRTPSENWGKVLEQYFTSDNVEKAISDAVQGQFLSFLQAIDSTLTPEQRNNLDSFMSSLTPPEQMPQSS